MEKVFFDARILKVIQHSYDQSVLAELINGKEICFFDPGLKIKQTMVGSLVQINANIGDCPKKINSRAYKVFQPLNLDKSFSFHISIKGKITSLVSRKHENRLHGLIDCKVAKLSFEC